MSITTQDVHTLDELDDLDPASPDDIEGYEATLSALLDESGERITRITYKRRTRFSLGGFGVVTEGQL